MSISLFLQGYNFNRATELIALDLIFVSTGYRIPLPKIKFNKPIVMDIRPDIDDDPNTYVSARVDRNFDQRIGGNTGFLYRRLPFDLASGPNPTEWILAPHVPFNTSDVLDQINTILNLQLTLNDILELSYTGEDSEMTLVTNPDSLVWLGTKTLRVTTDFSPPIVSKRDLSGFTIYQPNPLV